MFLLFLFSNVGIGKKVSVASFYSCVLKVSVTHDIRVMSSKKKTKIILTNIDKTFFLFISVLRSTFFTMFSIRTFFWVHFGIHLLIPSLCKLCFSSRSCVRITFSLLYSLKRVTCTVYWNVLKRTFTYNGRVWKKI